MGLFGLFMMTIGLGAMGFDSLRNSYSASKDRDQAIKEGKSYFRSGTKVYHTQTGAVLDEKFDYTTGHHLLVHPKTKQVIIDATLEKNLKKENDLKKLVNNSCVFYQKFEFGSSLKYGNIWVSDKLPGYYERVTFYYGGFQELPVEVFRKGTLIDRKDYHGYLYKDIHVEMDAQEYFPDGTEVTAEKLCDILNEMRKQNTMKSKTNNKFYHIFKVRKNRNGKEIVDEDILVYRKVDDDYYYAYKSVCTLEGYYIRLDSNKYDVDNYATPLVQYNEDGTDVDEWKLEITKMWG